jgi:hypothetical protein
MQLSKIAPCFGGKNTKSQLGAGTSLPLAIASYQELIEFQLSTQV